MLDFPGVVVTDFRRTYRDETDVIMTKIRVICQVRRPGEPADGGGRAG
jgi:hypothetical protein